MRPSAKCVAAMSSGIHDHVGTHDVMMGKFFGDFPILVIFISAKGHVSNLFG